MRIRMADRRSGLALTVALLAIFTVTPKALAVGEEEQQQQVCDVLAAVACFRDLSGAPTPDQVVFDVQNVIIEPCKDQMTEAQEMRTCLDEALADCMDTSLYTEIMEYVDLETEYCSEVADCGTDFATMYTTLQKCDNGFEEELSTAIGEGDDAKAAKCQELVDCLTAGSSACSALSLQAYEQWTAYSSTCGRVNVTMAPVEEDETEQMFCKNLPMKAKSLHECHVTYKTQVAAAADLSAKCVALTDFNACAETATLRCHTLEDAYEVVRDELMDITGPLCVEEDTCDFGAVAGCYATFGDSFWKVADIVGDAGDMDAVHERVQQSTGAFRDVTALCSDIEAEEANIRTCLQEALAECAGEFDSQFIMTANFVKELCAEIDACPEEPDLDAGVGECFSAADMVLKDLEIDGFQDNFCTVFEDMAQCTHAVLHPCPGDVMYVAGSWLQLKHDLDVMCPSLDLHMDNYTTEAIIEELVACGDLAERGTEISICRAEFFDSISMQLSDTETWCSAFEQFEKCLKDVSDECTILADDIALLVKETKDLVSSQCGQEDEEEEEENGGTGSDESEEENSASALAYSLIVLFLTLMLPMSL